MRYDWLEAYCLEKPGAIKEWQPDWEAFRYVVGGKMFLMDGEDKSGAKIITLKLEPLHGELVRTKYACITPGYYMNKVHWNSIRCDGDVPDDLLRRFIDESYTLIVRSLKASVRKEIEGI